MSTTSGKIKMDLFTQRYMQITCVLILFVFIDKYGHIPHSVWLVLTSSAIYSAFDPGSVIKKAYLCSTGTFTGIAAMVILWHVAHFDFRLVIFFLVFMSWALIFFQGVSYNRFIILFVMFSDLTFEIANSSLFSLQYYVVDRLITMLIVFTICILIEELWFGRSSLTLLNCRYQLKAIQQELPPLYTMCCAKAVTQARLFKEIKFIHQKIDHVNSLISDHMYEAEDAEFYAYAQPLSHQLTQDFRQIVSLIYLEANDSQNPIIPSMMADIEKKLGQYE